MYLVDRVLGKPKQKHEVDITENIQLTADQIDHLLEIKFGISIDDIRRYLEDTRKLLPNANVIDSEATPEDTGVSIE